MSKYAYTLLEIGGIQKYILQTGKLKEMIGGSEMIASLGSESDAVCEEMHLRSVTEPEETASGWDIVLQQAPCVSFLLRRKTAEASCRSSVHGSLNFAPDSPFTARQSNARGQPKAFSRLRVMRRTA